MHVARKQLWAFLAPAHVGDHQEACLLLDRLAGGAGGCPANLVDTEVLSLLTAAKAADALDQHISRFNVLWTLTGVATASAHAHQGNRPTVLTCWPGRRHFCWPPPFARTAVRVLRFLCARVPHQRAPTGPHSRRSVAARGAEDSQPVSGHGATWGKKKKNSCGSCGVQSG